MCIYFSIQILSALYFSLFYLLINKLLQSLCHPFLSKKICMLISIIILYCLIRSSFLFFYIFISSSHYYISLSIIYCLYFFYHSKAAFLSRSFSSSSLVCSLFFIYIFPHSLLYMI
ncbi:hypothetical protein BDA99DRAFT_515839 [Phascolomyces articulosus]|uniref:Uncharacterized protein n=1 Tax=Phascolomyces articulosus TaxID=60185 RepID=A0AAD5PC65_9FUNG|nr:hypothetical protein BDA99DRAFT_515839 [Phascolomyces articulosus]